MGREAWNLAKRNKLFNVNIYRRGLVALISSILLSCLFGLLMFYIYLTEPERDFYATSGIAPPVQLQPLSTPNYSSQSLLPPDPPVQGNEEKMIPQ